MTDDDFFDDEAAEFGEPVHPDDRLWRHPSELNKVPPPGARSIPDTVDFAPVPARRRGWVPLAVSGIVGAAVAVSVITMTGLGERVIESEDAASVTTRPLGFSSTTTSTTVADHTTTTASDVPSTTTTPLAPPPPDFSQAAATASPSMVWITVSTDEGSTDCAGLVVRSDGHLITNARVFTNAALSPAELSHGSPTMPQPTDAEPRDTQPTDTLPTNTEPANTEPVIIVRFHDGTTAPGDLVGIDTVTDLAVLRVDRSDLVPAPIGDPRTLQPGAPVLLLAADSAGQTAAHGAMINAVGTPARLDNDSVRYDMIRFDLIVPEAVSGGPLLDIEGNVVGLTVWAGDDRAYGLATPIDSAAAVATDLIEQGRARHPWLGIEVGQSEGEPTVIAVIGDTPAEASGLLPDDVIVSVDGTPVPTTAAFVTQIRTRRPGDEITITYRRDGTELDSVVVLGER